MLAAAQIDVLAHYGGAPEAAMVGVPLVIVLGFAYLERRARQRERALEPEQDAEG